MALVGTLQTNNPSLSGVSSKGAILLFALILVACGAERPADEDIVSACADAVESLEQCGERVPEDFAASCALIETQEELDDVLSVSETQCQPDAPKADLTGDGFAYTCAPVIVSASLLLRYRNAGLDEELTSEDLALYRRQFDHVDDVTFYFGAGLLDDWSIGGVDVQLGFDVGGQTFGNRVFIAEEYEPGDRSQRILLAHELEHSGEYVDRGRSLYLFAFDYCLAFYESNFSYRDNALEEDAREGGQAFERDYL